MGAHGTIGRAVTFQSSTHRKFARVKPELPYSLTLAQQYQRWLYEDYVAYWHQQSTLEKDVYRSAGVRFHLTAFQYFMKYHLANLPDIALLSHFDFVSGGITPDSSRNANHVTIVGASLVDGLIDHALYFDGINDYGRASHSSSLDITEALTIECIINPDTMDAGPSIKSIVSKGTYDVSYLLCYFRLPVRIEARINNGAGIIYPFTPDGLPHHIAFRYQHGIGGRIFFDGIPGALGVSTGFIDSVNQPLWIGDERTPTVDRDFHGSLDHLIIYNRALFDSCILRHSLRRYPP